MGWLLGANLSVIILIVGSLAVAKDDESGSTEDIIAALEEFNLLVGDWRGVGLPKRGSSQGSWQETDNCKWELTKQSAGLRWQANAGKLWSSVLISYSPATKL